MNKNETLAFALLFLLVAAVYFFSDPCAAWLPACPFHRLTGLLCPLCGAQRMTHTLLHLRLAEAFGYNAVLLLSLPYFSVLFIGYLLRSRHAFVFNRLLSLRAIIVYVLLFTLWGILRNVCFMK